MRPAFFTFLTAFAIFAASSRPAAAQDARPPDGPRPPADAAPADRPPTTTADGARPPEGGTGMSGDGAAAAGDGARADGTTGSTSMGSTPTAGMMPMPGTRPLRETEDESNRLGKTGSPAPDDYKKSTGCNVSGGAAPLGAAFLAGTFAVLALRRRRR